ncbi:MAG: toll/interleukin-1 receptor domain-containing protein [Chloroflexi bacterium]|nr:toll/interleukin-1 receptor domain-containing protein [Chloroflexota bacterium]
MKNFLEKLFSQKRLHKAFLCYCHADRDPVHALYSRLQSDGVQVWRDRESLLPGQNWEHEIRKAILGSDVILVCLSKNFGGQTGYRHEELKLALTKADVLPVEDISIIPVRLEECDLPESLQHLHRVDLFKRGGYAELLRALWKDNDLNCA